MDHHLSGGIHSPTQCGVPANSPALLPFSPEDGAGDAFAEWPLKRLSLCHKSRVPADPRLGDGIYDRTDYEEENGGNNAEKFRLLPKVLAVQELAFGSKHWRVIETRDELERVMAKNKTCDPGDGGNDGRVLRVHDGAWIFHLPLGVGDGEMTMSVIRHKLKS